MIASLDLVDDLDNRRVVGDALSHLRLCNRLGTDIRYSNTEE